MATFLYRLGRFAFRRRGAVVVAWLFLLALLGVGAATLGGSLSAALSIPGTESDRANSLLAERMPEAAGDGATADVVFSTGSGSLSDSGRAAAIEAVTARLKQLPHVAAVRDAVTAKQLSADGRVGFTTVTYSEAANDLTDADHDGLLRAGRSAESAGLTVEFSGDALGGSAGAGATEGLGIAVSAVVLVITFGALLAAGLPLLTALAGVGTGVLLITIAAGFVDLTSTTSTLALMLGLAVGIDYALFVVSRYRHELQEGRSGEDAAGRALGTAGSSVVFAGLTVVIALAALSVVGIPFLTQMGLGAAVTVAGAVLIALTLLPALLGFLGPRVLPRRARRTARDAAGTGERRAYRSPVPMGERWARFVIRRRWIVAVAGLVVLGVVAIPLASLRLGLPSDATAPTSTTERRAYDTLAAGFGAGYNGPLVVVVDATGAPAASRTAGVTALAGEISRLSDVATVTPATFTPDRSTAVITVIPGSGPADAATENLVHALRDLRPGFRSSTGATLYVTGRTAADIDISEKLAGALVPYLVVVVGLALVLLVLVFRSILVPLKATLGFLLSVAATFGAVVAVFQWGWLQQLIGVDGTGPILSFLPVLLIGILFGLAMDYEVFLVTRMREEHVHGADADTSVVLGFRHGARVVTAAAIIMIGVFAGFVLTDDPIIKSIGFALAFGVLVDAFVVRMAIVPAVMSLLGDRAWWIPRRLDQVMPDVDIEGAKLSRQLAQAASRPELPGPRVETPSSTPSQR